MSKITVYYWTGTQFESMNIKHNESFEYSKRKRNEIIDKVLKNGLQVMLYKIDETLIIAIDNRKFRQR